MDCEGMQTATHTPGRDYECVSGRNMKRKTEIKNENEDGDGERDKRRGTGLPRLYFQRSVSWFTYACSCLRFTNSYPELKHIRMHVLSSLTKSNNE